MIVHFGDLLSLPASIVAIGAFDGLHKGHQKLIQSALQQANELKIPLVVYTFDPPPKVLFQKVMRLLTLQEKLDRLESLGVHHVMVKTFDLQYLSRQAEDFHRDLYMLNPQGIWVGPDFMYGNNRQGNIDTLRRHFPVHVMEPVCCNSGKVISSTRIRQLIKENAQTMARHLMGWETGDLKKQHHKWTDHKSTIQIDK